MRKTKGDPDTTLARLIVSQAVLDYLALSFPAQCPRYIHRWYRTSYGAGGGDYEAWRQQRLSEAEAFLNGDGQTLAELANMEGAIEKARQSVKKRCRDAAAWIEQSAKCGGAA